MSRAKRNSGFALATLMVILTLASIAALLAMRHLWVNEKMLNAEADQLRTQQKAEAVLPVARIDIVGPSATTSGEVTPNLRHVAGNSTQTQAFFPTTLTDYDLLRQRLGANACSTDLCTHHAGPQILSSQLLASPDCDSDAGDRQRHTLRQHHHLVLG